MASDRGSNQNVALDRESDQNVASDGGSGMGVRDGGGGVGQAVVAGGRTGLYNLSGLAKISFFFWPGSCPDPKASLLLGFWLSVLS